MYNDILADMKTHKSPEVSEGESISPSASPRDSEDESQSGVVDYGTYSKVCEDYRKACIALQERESEVADLIKQNEAKALAVKLLQDRLQLYGVTVHGDLETPSDVPFSQGDDHIAKLQAIINEQKHLIETLLGNDGQRTDLEQVNQFLFNLCLDRCIVRKERRGVERNTARTQSSEKAIGRGE